jgi:ATP-binding cassette, subfamily B, bacterial PglK
MKLSIGILESFTMAWIAGFASWLINIDTIKKNKLYQLIDQYLPGIIPEAKEDLIIWGTVILVSLVVIRNCTQLISIYFSNRFAILLQTELGHTIVSKIFSRPYHWYIKQQPSMLIQTFTWRLNIGGFLQQYLGLMTKTIVLTSLVLTMIIYEPKISIPVLCVLSLLSISLFKIAKPILRKLSTEIKNIRKKIFKETASSIHGYKDIKLIGAERFLTERLKKRFDMIISLSMRRRLTAAAPSLILEIMVYLLLASAVIFMVRIQGNTLDDILALFALMAIASWKIMPLISQLLKQHNSIVMSIPFVEHVLDFLEEEVDETYTGIEQQNNHFMFESLELSKVCFAYNSNEHLVLNDITFNIQKGEKVGVIGFSGTGKTTLIDIISGLLVPGEGNIKINGMDLNETFEAEWKNTIGYLPQHPYIFPGSISENIAFGIQAEEQDHKLIKKSLLAVKLGELEERGSKYEELIESGRNLSGGQAQRLALARLHYINKDFIIIDEGTSALDIETEKYIVDNLLGTDRLQTMIIITHRIDSLARCDRVIWLDQGSIIMDDKSDIVLNAFKSKLKT